MRNFLETDAEMCALEMLGWNDWEGPWALFRRITTPIVIIVGEDEDREGNNRRAVDLLPKGRLVTIPTLGHVGAFLRSDLVLPHALAFLAEVVGAAKPSRSRLSLETLTGEFCG